MRDKVAVRIGAGAAAGPEFSAFGLGFTPSSISGPYQLVPLRKFVGGTGGAGDWGVRISYGYRGPAGSVRFRVQLLGDPTVFLKSVLEERETSYNMAANLTATPVSHSIALAGPWVITPPYGVDESIAALVSLYNVSVPGAPATIFEKLESSAYIAASVKAEFSGFTVTPSRHAEFGGFRLSHM